MTTMTFCMSPINAESKVEMEEEEEEEENTGNRPKSIKEMEEEKAAEKAAQQKRDDIALVIGMFCILAVTVAVVVLKVNFIDPEPLNVSTFAPLPQAVNDDKKYVDFGYIPCNGHVPCQPAHLSPENLAERMENAEPCHDYNDKGAGPEGCW